MIPFLANSNDATKLEDKIDLLTILLLLNLGIKFKMDDDFDALTEIRFVFFLESSFLLTCVLRRRRDKEDFDAATRMRSKNIKERGFSPLGMVVVVVVVIIAFD